MPISPAVSAFGTFLKIGDGASPEGFTTIAEVLSITGPSMVLGTVDVTTHSTGTPWRQFIGTLLDAGNLAFDINFIPTNSTHSYSAGLLKDMVNRTQRSFRLVFPDQGSTTWTFTGLVVSFQCTEAIDNVIKAAVSIKLSGQPTLA